MTDEVESGVLLDDPAFAVLQDEAATFISAWGPTERVRALHSRNQDPVLASAAWSRAVGAHRRAVARRDAVTPVFIAAPTSQEK